MPGEGIDRVGGVLGRDGVGQRARPGQGVGDLSIVRAHVALAAFALRRELGAACGRRLGDGEHRRGASEDRLDRVGEAGEDLVGGRAENLLPGVPGGERRVLLATADGHRDDLAQQRRLGRVQDDMVAEHWACRDDVSGFRQLGLQPGAR